MYDSVKGVMLFTFLRVEHAHKFAYQTTTGEKELIIAKALIGDTFDYGLERNTQLKRYHQSEGYAEWFTLSMTV